MSEFIFKPVAEDKVLICKLANLKELVRCRDCNWYDRANECCKRLDIECFDNFFCADGERKDG